MGSSPSRGQFNLQKNVNKSFSFRFNGINAPTNGSHQTALGVTFSLTIASSAALH